MKYSRHTLVDSSQGRKRLFADIVSKGMEVAHIGQMLLPEDFPMMNASSTAADGRRLSVPGIVRRGDGKTPACHVPVGLVSWKCGIAGRFRLPTQITFHEIEADTVRWMYWLRAQPSKTIPAHLACVPYGGCKAFPGTGT